MPFFSIIVPIYKVEKYLDECVRSVLSQSFGDYECVLVDDGSPDNCPAMCDEYEKKYEKIKVVHKENGGLSDARNAGILQASGEYVVLLDSDDKFVDDDALQNLFGVIQKYKTDVIVNVNFLTFTDDGEKELLNRYAKDITIASPKCIVDGFNKARMYMAGWLYVLNREHLIKNNLFFKKGLLHEDEHWWPRVLFTTQQIAVNHSSFYAYRVGRKGSIKSNVSAKRLLALLSIIGDLLEWAKGEKIYGKEGCNYMIERAKKLCYGVNSILRKNKHIKQQSKKDYCDICKELRKQIKKIPVFYLEKLLLSVVILGVDNTDILLKFYGKIKRILIPKLDKIGKNNDIKIAYLSGPGFADVDFSMVRELRKKVNLYYFIIITPYTLRSTAINIKKQYPISGIFNVNVYPEIEMFSDNFDLEKTYVVNICSRKTSLKSIFVFGKLLFMLMRLNINILHITSYYNHIRFLLYFLYKKTILTVHDPIPHSDTHSREDVILRKIAFHFIKNFIIFNENQKDEFISTYKLKDKNIYVSKLGIYDFLHRYKDNVHAASIKDKKEYILFFGRITSYKGLDFLFPAMKLVNKTHNNIKLIIAGYCRNYYFDISEYEKCSFIEIRNKFIPDDELAILIQNALFVVCPYIDATQSGVVMSSFAFNIPVLATNTGGLPEYVEHIKSGYIVEPKDINGLADGIKYLLDNRELLNEQRKFIEEKYTVGDHSWNKITDDLIVFYKSVINYKRNSGRD